LKERLASFAEKAREKAGLLRLGQGTGRLLLMSARQADTVSHIDEWAASSGLQSQKFKGLATVDKPAKKPATTFFLDLDNDDKALRLAKQIAEKTGREVGVCDSDGNLIGAVKPTRH
jgi:hypothetical protein